MTNDASGEQPGKQLIHLCSSLRKGVAGFLVDASLHVTAATPTKFVQPLRDVDLMRRHSRVHHLGATVQP